MPAGDNPEYTSGWDRWSKHVLKELERLNEAIGDLNDKVEKISMDKISNLEKELAVMKTRVLIIGSFVAFFISAIVSVGMRFIN